MLLRQLKVSGLLSFGPAGIDLQLRPLNVFIGANGSGKSNLLEVLSLLRAAPTKLPNPVKEMGGIDEWLWKGLNSTNIATVQAVVSYSESPSGKDPLPLRHELKITKNGDRFEVADEKVENELARPGNAEPYFFYQYRQGNPWLNTRAGTQRLLKRANILPEESILSQVRDPEEYPELAWLQTKYEEIALYRNWSFGPASKLRVDQKIDSRSSHLADDGHNLANVLSSIKKTSKNVLLESIQELLNDVTDFDIELNGLSARVYLNEGVRQTPASRLSDGTLRYLCLLAILLHPRPPAVVAIEEPELGLHPDIIPHIAKLLVDASTRMQLFVTTHSRVLVDCLSASPEDVVVCSKVDGESRFERLDAGDLASWLERYSLGELWSKGELGGNRW